MSTQEVSVWLRQTMTMLTDILQCPLITTSTKTTFQLEDDAYSDFILAEDRPVFEILKHFILPGLLRQHLLEWLLNQFEDGILNSAELKGIT